MMLISRCTLRGLKRVASMPFSRMRPAVGSNRRVTSLTTVVLPAPFSPTSASAWPLRDGERHIRQHIAIGQRIAEADALELDRIDGSAPLFARVEIARRQLEKLEQVAHVEQALVDAGHAVEQSRELTLNLDDAADEEREIADRDGAVRRAAQHRERGERDQQRRSERGRESPRAAPCRAG